MNLFPIPGSFSVDVIPPPQTLSVQFMLWCSQPCTHWLQLGAVSGFVLAPY